ncbi:MAG: 2-oxo-4-hydroxy-4-carboxy-5-ureidoimidazoline decarboxylase [Verrucomicrobiota bacterium]
MPQKLYTIAEINVMSPEQFVRVMGPVFENSPWIAAQGVELRRCGNLTTLHQGLCEIVLKSPPEKQIGLIQAHPDLVGPAALQGELTEESSLEQQSAGLGELTRDEIELFQKSNDAYRSKFGFPFVICARLNKKKAILKRFAVRLQNRREKEIKTALEEILKIALLRLQNLVES